MPPRNGEPSTASAPRPADRVVTLPNALSLLRLLGVPVFLWLLLGPHADLVALVVLMVAGATDWLDGKLARALGQTSRLGVLLDPAADRLYILATLSAFVLRDIVPWWLAAVLIGRDLVLGLCIPLLRHHGYAPLPVHYLGKAATFNLLYAFPLLLLADRTDQVGDVARPIGWAFAIWGTALYLWSAALYLIQAGRLIRSPDAAPDTAPDAAVRGTGPA